MVYLNCIHVYSAWTSCPNYISSPVGGNSTNKMRGRYKNMKKKSTPSLLVCYSEILRELRRREVVRTSNSPTGDYAELLACKKFNLKPAPNSTKSYDATDNKGKRYQIKSRRLTAEN